MTLPSEQSFSSTLVGSFDELVYLGEEESYVTLSPPLHQFLVTCLTRHQRDHRLFDQALVTALMFCENIDETEQATPILSRVGDAALLLAGLHTSGGRRHIRHSTLRFVGQGAYANLARRLENIGEMRLCRNYSAAAEHFTTLERVLNALSTRPNVAERSWEKFRSTFN